MSHYSESLNNKRPMCPCSSPKDIPQDAKEASEESEAVENGFEVLSADSGSDEEQDALGAQGYVPLSQNEDETIAQDTTVVQQEASVINQPDEEQMDLDTQPELEEAEKLNNVTASSTFAFSSTTKSRMGEDEIDLIKSVMMNIKLPSSSIPEWAKKIPEDKWKAPLVSSIKQQSSSEEKCIDRKSS